MRLYSHIYGQSIVGVRENEYVDERSCKSIDFQTGAGAQQNQMDLAVKPFSSLHTRIKPRTDERKRAEKTTTPKAFH